MCVGLASYEFLDLLGIGLYLGALLADRVQRKWECGVHRQCHWSHKKGRGEGPWVLFVFLSVKVHCWSSVKSVLLEYFVHHVCIFLQLLMHKKRKTPPVFGYILLCLKKVRSVLNTHIKKVQVLSELILSLLEIPLLPPGSIRAVVETGSTK